METAILLAVAASLCTGTSSVCQRMGARSSQTPGFDAGLVFRLARRPVWLLGMGSMILGFILQLTALHFGELALVQPILAAELVFVFGYLAIAGSGRVKRRDWLAAAAMSAGIGVFLRVAAPSGGRLHAPGSSWLIAGLATFGVVVVALAVAFGLGRRPSASGTRRAAVLGAATGISWGFMAAVIKELSSHLGNGVGAIFSSWSLYLLIAAGAATMLLASHALAAGPLAASQPGFTILDPLSASLLGMFLFGEHFRTGAADLAGEALALAVVVAAAAVLSHSCHLAGENGHPSHLAKPTVSSAANAPPAAGGSSLGHRGQPVPHPRSRQPGRSAAPHPANRRPVCRRSKFSQPRWAPARPPRSGSRPAARGVCWTSEYHPSVWLLRVIPGADARPARAFCRCAPRRTRRVEGHRDDSCPNLPSAPPGSGPTGPLAVRAGPLAGRSPASIAALAGAPAISGTRALIDCDRGSAIGPQVSGDWGADADDAAGTGRAGQPGPRRLTMNNEAERSQAEAYRE